MQTIGFQPSNPPKDIEDRPVVSGFLRAGGLPRNPPSTLHTLPAKAKRSADIEEVLHWAYAKEGVGRCDPGPVREIAMLSAETGESGDGMAAVDRYVALGTVIDVPSPRSAEAVHPDALQLDGLVQRLDTIERELVVKYAKGMGRPDWRGPGPSRFAPVWREKRRARPVTVDIRDRRGKRGPHAKPPEAPVEYEIVEVRWDANGHRVAPYCPVRWVDTTEAVQAARDRYTVWFRAVQRVWIAFCGNRRILTGWHVTGFQAPETPWLAHGA